MVGRLEPVSGEVADSAFPAQFNRIFFATGWHAVDDEVGKLHEDALKVLLSFIVVSLQSFDTVRHLFSFSDELGFCVLVFFRRDLLAERFLLSTDLFKFRNRGSAR